jgi:hypothetical protein
VVLFATLTSDTLMRKDVPSDDHEQHTEPVTFWVFRSARSIPVRGGRLRGGVVSFVWFVLFMSFDTPNESDKLN